jgi:hypothetical protein
LYSFVCASNKIRIICRFSGDTGNGMQNQAGCYNNQFSNGMQFTTRDADNDKHSTNCASPAMGDGGWWHNACFQICLTCKGNQFRWLSAASVCTIYPIVEARMLMKLQ